MDLQDRKRQLIDELNRNQILIQQLYERNLKILGQIELIDEIERNKNEQTKSGQ